MRGSTWAAIFLLRASRGDYVASVSWLGFLGALTACGTASFRIRFRLGSHACGPMGRALGDGPAPALPENHAYRGGEPALGSHAIVANLDRNGRHELH